ncbi:MAG: hypothetical protein Q9160_001647 [Pyrenula sp. 1 TL-2023]
MAWTAPKIPLTEHREESDVVDRKAQSLVNMIRKSKHFIAFTGAGVSTSAGIPDFRGPDGAWTLRAQGRQRTSKVVSTLQAIPTPTHMALVELQKRGILKYLVSQNCDGLHRKSGIAPDKISELHGNSNREYCKDCGKEYIRGACPDSGISIPPRCSHYVDFRAVATYEKTVRDHRTGRKCARCGGALHDSIVNFGESLPAQPQERAFSHAKKADLCLVLGSSLTVTPANEIPEIVGERPGANFAICNLQKTPLDQLSDLRVYSTSDDLMTRVMEKLDIPILPFILYRRLIIEVESKGEDRHDLTVSGVDVDGTPVTFLESVRCESSRRVARSEPFVLNFRGNLDAGLQVKLDLKFMGHYGEPDLEIIHECSNRKRDAQSLYLLEYNPQTGEWKTSKQDDLPTGDGMRDDVEKEGGAKLIATADAGMPDNVKPTPALNMFIDLTV